MIRPLALWGPGGERPLSTLPAPLPLDELLPGESPWEVELGFGKGRFLLDQAERHPSRRYLGIEMVGKYFRLALGRAERRGLENLLLIRGEALLVAATVLPRRMAQAVHVYFPDPWPKDRHQKRRLFDVDTVDLLLGLLEPGGKLYFATDHLEYGNQVRQVLEGVPGLTLLERSRAWDGEGRTNYEIKYMREGRPILRLEAIAERIDEHTLHPAGAARVLVGPP